VSTESGYMGAHSERHESRRAEAALMEEDVYDEDQALYSDDPINPRRTQATIVMVLGALVFLFSLVVLAAFITEQEGLLDVFGFWEFQTWVWVFFGAIFVLLVWLVILLLTTPPRAEGEWYHDETQREGGIAVARPAELGATDTISLRCPKCMNIFSLQDPGERPFYHDCPHCEVRGMYSGP
jgi:hypothetical protein